MPQLLDTGSSGNGWSNHGLFVFCPQKWAWTYLDARGKLVARDEDPTRIALPLKKGTFLHAATGHHYGLKLGMDLYDVNTAMRMIADKYAIEAKIVADLRTIVAAYFKKYQYEDWKVLAVERLVRAEIVDPKTGLKIPISARIDRIVQAPNRKVYFVDTKSSFLLTEDITTKYTLSGQFKLQDRMGEKLYGARFGGMWVDGVTSRANNLKFLRLPLPPSPGTTWAHFERAVIRAYHEREELLSENTPRDQYPRRMHEQICVTSYGACEFLRSCQWGV